jgi:hypothetical protein
MAAIHRNEFMLLNAILRFHITVCST